MERMNAHESANICFTSWLVVYRLAPRTARACYIISTSQRKQTFKTAFFLLFFFVSHQVPKYLSQQWEKAAEKGEVGKISIGKQVVKCVHAVFLFKHVVYAH